MKNLKKVLALVLAVVMIMGTVAVASAKDYSDVKADNTYADAIDALSGLNILNGFPDETFRPDGLLTRAEAAKIVAIIHNAATNGKIDADIADLYKNAQNSFVDCNNSWALPYINYCRITGLADGMTTTTYEPNRKLTGVQFLKLMLTTLNFDSAKEGYTGKGWDINVLNRANEVGLTDGLAEGWQGIAELKRGEAAQIIYNALTKYLVEYGQLVKNNYDKTDKYYKTSFISNEQVAKSGYTLGAKMGVKIVRATDAYRRPGYSWSYAPTGWSAFYMDTPKASYTTFVSMCDILKVMGVPETSSKSVVLNGWYQGDSTSADRTTKASELKVDGKTVNFTALNYYAVDGFKYGHVAMDDGLTGITLKHETDKSCQKESNQLHPTGAAAWRTHEFGGQGDLTQVFKTEDGWVITTIHTFLGEVTKLHKNGKYSHATSETAEIRYWLQTLKDGPDYVDAVGTTEATVDEMSYTVGTKILVQLSLKKSEVENKVDSATGEGQYIGNAPDGAAATVIAAAESKTGKLTGASDYTYPETVSIDGTKYNTNCRFALGKEAAMNIKNNGTTYTFYFDTYGNVIGRVDEVVTTAAEYVVLDRIYGVHENGKFAIKADMHDLTGTAIEGASVAIAGSFADAKDGYDNAGNYSTPNNYPGDHFIYMVSKHNDSDLTDALYTYKLSDKGVYTLTWVGDATTSTNVGSLGGIVLDPDALGYEYGKMEGYFVHTAKLAYLEAYPNSSLQYTGKAMTVHPVAGYDISLSESTKFVVKNTAGEYKTYTGYTELPALTASVVDYVDTDKDGYADIVYMSGAVYAADKVTGWVLKWTPLNWANGYDLITVYVDGEPVVVNVKHSTIVDGKDSLGNDLHPGLYTFETKVDEDGVTYSEFYAEDEDASQWMGEAVESYSTDATAIKVKDSDGYTQTIGLTDVVIYNVLADGTVVKADASCIEEGDFIVYSKVSNQGNAPYAVIYVLDKTIPYI